MIESFFIMQLMPTVIALSAFLIALVLFLVWLLVTRKKMAKELEILRGRFDLLDLSSKTGAFLSSVDFIIANRNALSMIFDRAPHGFFIKDERGRFLFVNSTFADMYGLSKEDILGKTVQEIGGSEAEYRKFQSAKDRLKNEQSQIFMPVYILTRPDGTKFTMKVVKFPLKGAGEETIMLMGIGGTLANYLGGGKSSDDIKLQIPTLLDNIDGVAYRCRLDKNWTMIYMSKGCEKLTGYKESNFLGNKKLSYNDIILDEDKEKVFHVIHRAVTKDEPFQMEYRIRKADGSIRWVWEQGVCVFSSGSNESLLEGYITDITNIKETANSLRMTEERLQVALEGSGCGLWDYNIVNDDLIVTEELKAIFGYDIVDMMGSYKHWIERVHPEDLDVVSKKVKFSFTGGSDTFNITLRIKAKDESWRWVVVKGRVLERDSSNYAIRAVGTVIDITEQKIVEETVEKQLNILKSPEAKPIELNFEELFDFKSLREIQEAISSIFGIASVITDVNGNPMLSSSNARKLCTHFVRNTKQGLENCTIVGAMSSNMKTEGPILNRCRTMGFLEGGIAIKSGERHLGNWLLGQIIDEEFDEEKALKFAKDNNIDLEEFKTELAKVPRISRLEFESICKVVYLIAQQISKLAMHNLEQARDILARIRSERELQLKNAEMERIIYISSHDLRSPLVNIQGFSLELKRSCEEMRELLHKKELTSDEQVKLDYILDSDIPESLAFINASANKMDMLQKGLLQISRLGRADMDMQQINMNYLIRDILAASEYQIRQKDIKVEVENIPDCIGDIPRINQVFTNIIDNALKYLPEDRPARIKITGEKVDGKAVYCVEDNGKGIPANNLETIFDLFYRVDPADGKTGEGLGLCLVKRIVERHSGRVWAESEVGEYSRFFVELTSI